MLLLKYQSKENELNVLCSRNNSDKTRIRLTSAFSSAAVVVREQQNTALSF